MSDTVWRFLADTAESYGFSLGDAVALWQACGGVWESYVVAAASFDPEEFYRVR